MSVLAPSPLHKLCRALVAPLDRPRVLEAAFREKLRELEEKRAGIGEEKAAAIALAREWSYAFPDSG
ncbi:hypothetical protein, partial [Salmonella enterica]|uniref:hypothetical protein n=1 Tax=Salmonella enterica TaxID=28901 RepID=UPI003D290CB8